MVFADLGNFQRQLDLGNIRPFEIWIAASGCVIVGEMTSLEQVFRRRAEIDPDNPNSKKALEFGLSALQNSDPSTNPYQAIYFVDPIIHAGGELVHSAWATVKIADISAWGTSASLPVDFPSRGRP